MSRAHNHCPRTRKAEPSSKRDNSVSRVTARDKEKPFNIRGILAIARAGIAYHHATLRQHCRPGGKKSLNIRGLSVSTPGTKLTVQKGTEYQRPTAKGWTRTASDRMTLWRMSSVG